VRLTFEIFGRKSVIDLWRKTQQPVAQAVPAGGVTEEQREALFREWNEKKASIGSGTHLSTSGRFAASSSNRSGRTVGFQPNEEKSNASTPEERHRTTEGDSRTAVGD